MVCRHVYSRSMEPATYTRREVAELLKVSVRTVERWEAAGLITPLRIGGTVRFRAEDVDALVTAGGAA